MDERVVGRESVLVTVGKGIGAVLGHVLLALAVFSAFLVAAFAGLVAPRTVQNSLKRTLGKQYLEDLRRAAVEQGQVHSIVERTRAPSDASGQRLH